MNIIHYDPTRVDYTLSESELEKIKSASSNTWKDFFILCVSVGAPCSINAIAEIQSQTAFAATLSLNLNLMFGIVGILLAVAFLIAWMKTKTDIDSIIKDIKNKPQIKIDDGLTSVGAINIAGPKLSEQA